MTLAERLRRTWPAALLLLILAGYLGKSRDPPAKPTDWCGSVESDFDYVSGTRLKRWRRVAPGIFVVDAELQNGSRCTCFEDILLRAYFFAPSATRLGTKDQTVYVALPPGAKSTIQLRITAPDQTSRAVLGLIHAATCAFVGIAPPELAARQ